MSKDEVIEIDPALLEDDEDDKPLIKSEHTPSEKLENSIIVTILHWQCLQMR